MPTNVPYYFKVTASDDGHAAWTLISSPNDQACKFGTSWAVDVDKDPSRATFGRIYCTSTWVREHQHAAGSSANHHSRHVRTERRLH